VLQALYFCRPFRDKVLQYKHQQKNQKKETLLMCLADLFYNIANQKKKVGTLAPKRFITRLRKECGKILSTLFYRFYLKNIAFNSQMIMLLLKLYQS